ncbi:MAG TPA: ComEC/Rec2 family competence protein [Bacillota bacterium]|nr:ComEC/Rec2 family competence protein [Bacillota bacterium]HOL11909.1 ComEC/Rec2 family competence protein [Bacillota bacterium]
MAPSFNYHRYFVEPSGEGRPKGFTPPQGLSGLFRGHVTPLFSPSVGFILGATFPMSPFKLKILFSLLFFAGAAMYRAFRLRFKEITSNPHIKNMLILFLALSGYVLGCFRAYSWDEKMYVAESLEGKYESIVIEVIKNPRVKGDRIEFIGTIENMDGSKLPEGSQNLKAQVYLYDVSDGLLVQLPKVGQVVTVSGKISVPPRANNPGEFDYRRYLMDKGVFLQVKGNLNERWEVTSKRALHKVFPSIANYIEKRIDDLFVGEERGILKGIFLGDKCDLSPDDADSFRSAGLSRFISVAGFHVGIAATWVEIAVKKLTRNVNLGKISAIGAAYLWAGLSGFAVGPFRAFLCILMKHGAFWSRRKYNPLAGLAVCGVIIGFRVPYPLLSVSFQLSFAGMMAGQVVGEYGRTFTESFDLGMIRQRLLESVLMASLLFPILASSFDDVSIVGFLLAGVWSMFTVAAMVCALPMFLCPLFLGKIFSWLPFLVLRGMTWVGRLTAALPFASFSFPAPKAAQIMSYYGIIFVLFSIFDEKNNGQVTGRDRARIVSYCSRSGQRNAMWRDMWSTVSWKYVTILALSVILFVSVFTQYYFIQPQVVFLSVGQGDSAVVRFKRSVIVVDTGTEDAARRVLIPFLKKTGVGHIDLCVLSHLDADHAGGINLLCKTFDVNEVMTCPGSRDAVVQLIQGNGNSGKRHGVSEVPRVIEAHAGQVYEGNQTTMTVVYPGRSDYTGSFSNEDSLVFALQFQGFPMYFEFWGDAPGKAVATIMDQVFRAGVPIQGGLRNGDFVGDLPMVPIIKVPHHGSCESLIHGFYQRLSGPSSDGASPAGVAVISVGPNPYGHPSFSVIEAAGNAGFKVMRTDSCGAITICRSMGTVLVLPYHSEKSFHLGTYVPLWRRF